MARPGRGDSLQQDLQKAKDEGVDQVISFLTDDEIAKAELQAEPETCDKLGIDFRRLPIVDHECPPADKGTMDFLRSIERDLKAGQSIALHCNQGRGRTTLVGASVLVLEGMDPDRAIQRMRGRRLVSVPDGKNQTEWVRALARRRQPRQRALEAAAQARSQHRRRVAAAVLGAVGIAAVAITLRARARI